MEDNPETLLSLKVTNHIFFLMINLISDAHLGHSEFLNFMKKIVFPEASVTKEKSNNILISENMSACSEINECVCFE